MIDDPAVAGDKAFKWEEQFKKIMGEGGFDVVIGNPPYSTVTIESEKEYFSRTLKTTEGRFDTFELFIERAIGLCKEGGFIAYIVPNTLLSNLYSRKLRKHILETCKIVGITNFGMDVFDDPTVHTCIIILQKGRRNDNVIRIKKQVGSREELNKSYDYEISQQKMGGNSNSTFDVFVDPASNNILQKIETDSVPLGKAFIFGNA